MRMVVLHGVVPFSFSSRKQVFKKKILEEDQIVVARFTSLSKVGRVVTRAAMLSRLSIRNRNRSTQWAEQ